MFKQQVIKMFEVQPKKSSARTSLAPNNPSTSRSKFLKKQLTLAQKQSTFAQKLMIDCVKTDSQHVKQKKSKSQGMSKQHQKQRKSIDVCKIIQSARTTHKKSRQKNEKIMKTYDMFHTQIRSGNPSYLCTQKSAEMKTYKKNSVKKNTEGRSVQRKRLNWNDKNVPLDYVQVLQNYSHYLTKYEHNQIRQYKKIYYVGHKAAKRQQIDVNSHVFDNQEKQYRFVQNDHIAYRYELINQVGKGSYGQVYKAFDHKHKQQIALKIIKNDPKFAKQAFIQIKILSMIKQRDVDQGSNVVRIKDFVIFRKHVCIVFQLLSENLYQLIIRNNYNGLNSELIRRVAIQILIGLQFLRSHHIIHCDLKPENILLKQYNKSGIKMIDFGSSCLENQTLYTYIQSRYYRAPQISLGVPYDHKIDIWSTGCILTELYTGVPVFPGENEDQQMKYMTQTLGMPPKKLLVRGSRSNVFFDQEYKIKPQIKQIKTTIDIFSKPLKERIEDPDFLSFIQAFLQWMPEDRIEPLNALNHPWITKGLPNQLKNRLSQGSNVLQKAKQQKSVKRIKTKSRQRCASGVKINNKSSQQKLKKNYAVRY